VSVESDLAELGGALGSLAWVQGPGGNVSVKTETELVVKASGTLLANVALPAHHARVPLDVARRALEGDHAADAALFAIQPRPSLETYFHALDGRVIAHTHALGVLLYACSNAPFERVVEPGITSIPYVRPGRDVALAIRDAILPGTEHTTVLRSHGIVAIAESAARAIELTRAFDERVRARFGKMPVPIEAWTETYMHSATTPIEGGVTRSLPQRMPRTLPPRYLFPDAAVCATVVFADRSDRDSASTALATLTRACIVVDSNGNRHAVARDDARLRQTCEVAAAHDWLEDALTSRGVASYLPGDEPEKIVAMPSEQYRIRVETKR
jgi:ribulose-5-phosphate 4-epimerase/fuculose-1-phosphate aldolase